MAAIKKYANNSQQAIMIQAVCHSAVPLKRVEACFFFANPHSLLKMTCMWEKAIKTCKPQHIPIASFVIFKKANIFLYAKEIEDKMFNKWCFIALVTNLKSLIFAKLISAEGVWIMQECYCLIILQATKISLSEYLWLHHYTWRFYYINYCKLFRIVGV